MSDAPGAPAPLEVHDGEQDDALALAVARLAPARHVLVALDFDGTLAPFADDPMAVRPVAGAAQVLDGVARGARSTLALVSGRRLADLARLASPPPGTLLAGSHGAQVGRIDADGALVTEPDERTEAEEQLLAMLTADLEAIVAGAPGAWIEEKAFARVLHTRRCAPAEAERATRAAVDGPAARPDVHPIVGKAVVELGVRATTKADAVARLRAQAAADADLPEASVAVVFAGDDTTDETALASLGPADLGIKVGDGETAAAIRVPDEAGVVALLHGLAAAL
ncbi:trehalose-phosphatase [Miniimonas arenae]|uniref:Trehalose 6-phosphate phosphatase n=2 Tax=Miniimonas arenae TaxID=676201 RepID=A0A5C5BFJ0_9MICO|nr:trehalose-phosphatase [Miniimonas arenae]TNU76732.1 trehalose-phosphatase [Miniimonas arenae]